MKKLIIFTLVASLFLVGCLKRQQDTFTVYEVNSCSDYFDYLYTPVDAPTDRQAGTVYKIECEGVMDFQEDNRLPYGFLIQTENYEEQRIGLHVLDADSDRMLETLNGQPLTVKGELHIQSLDPNGAGLYAKTKDIKVIPAF